LSSLGLGELPHIAPTSARQIRVCHESADLAKTPGGPANAPGGSATVPTLREGVKTSRERLLTVRERRKAPGFPAKTCRSQPVYPMRRDVPSVNAVIWKRARLLKLRFPSSLPRVSENQVCTRGSFARRLLGGYHPRSWLNRRGNSDQRDQTISELFEGGRGRNEQFLQAIEAISRR
jgi:hypothetical protein